LRGKSACRKSKQPAIFARQERASRSGQKRCGRTVLAEERGGIRGRPGAAGRTDAESCHLRP
jgi:hypothetical protein